MSTASDATASVEPGSSNSRGQFENRVRSTPETNMTPFLAREDIIDGIKEVAAELRNHGVTGTIQLVGGAAIVLTVNAERRLTRDIDAVLAPKADVEHAAAIVAARRHWPGDWLNDDAAQFVSNGLAGPPNGRPSTEMTPSPSRRQPTRPSWR